jgi:DNA-directed RNA polymerase subunit RPC12/RpoP
MMHLGGLLYHSARSSVRLSSFELMDPLAKDCNMPDDREIAREILSGKISVEDAGRLRHTSAGPAIRGASTASKPPAVAAPPIQAGAVPENKAPVVTSVPAEGRKFPCKNCGARLDFDPSERALKCPYCGHVEEIAPSNTKIVEHDYAQALAKVQMDTGTIAGRSSEVRCPGCGAQVLLEDNVETEKCPFCATHLENVPRTSAAAMICPESLLPFHATQREAIDKFNGWIKTRWFAPNNLKQLANLGQLSGVYMPFWTYDSMTYTHYTGQRGDDYWETEYYTDSQGHRQSRQVVRTRWTYVSGEVDHFFDDVLVCASKSLPRNEVDALEPWDLGHLEGFRGEFLSGFRTERYVVSLGDGFGIAQQIMDVQIRRLCCQNIGGDHQQLSSVQTQHVGVTFKHILLPMWLAVYRYQNKMFRILVNARTGEVFGERPYSWVKIMFAVLAGIVVLLIILAIAHASRH